MVQAPGGGGPYPESIINWKVVAYGSLFIGSLWGVETLVSLGYGILLLLALELARWWGRRR